METMNITLLATEEQRELMDDRMMDLVSQAFSNTQTDYENAMKATGSFSMMIEKDGVYLDISQYKDSPGEAIVTMMSQDDWLDKISSNKKSKSASYGKTVGLNLKDYSIWCEGFRASGEIATATFWGVSQGEDFHDACKRFVETNASYSQNYDSEGNSYWGCRLFDNEQDARKSFG